MMALFILIILTNKTLTFYKFIFYLSKFIKKINQFDLCSDILTPNVRR